MYLERTSGARNYAWPQNKARSSGSGWSSQPIIGLFAARDSGHCAAVVASTEGGRRHTAAVHTGRLKHCEKRVRLVKFSVADRRRSPPVASMSVAPHD